MDFIAVHTVFSKEKTRFEHIKNMFQKGRIVGCFKAGDNNEKEGNTEKDEGKPPQMGVSIFGKVT